MLNLYGEEISESGYVKGNYGTNQKKSGDAFENLMTNALRQKYPDKFIATQHKILGSEIRSKKTKKLRKKRYKVDILFNYDTVISAKKQSTGGTTEQKIMYELYAIEDMFETNPHLKHAYIVYAGEGFKIFDEEFVWIPAFKRAIERLPWIKIMSYDDFMKEI
jgi:hypothetical protein